MEIGIFITREELEREAAISIFNTISEKGAGETCSPNELAKAIADKLFGEKK